MEALSFWEQRLASGEAIAESYWGQAGKMVESGVTENIKVSSCLYKGGGAFWRYEECGGYTSSSTCLLHCQITEPRPPTSGL